MTALLIICVIAALIVILFSVRIRAVLSFSLGNDSIVEMSWLFLKIRILPKEEKEKPAKPEAPAQPAVKSGKKRDTGEILNLIKASYKDLKDGLFKILAYIIKHAVTVDELNISAAGGFDDPVKTGMAAGAANAAVYGVIGILERNMKLKSRTVSISPDFDEEGLKAGVYCLLSTNIFHILALGGIFAKTAFKILYKAWKIKK